MNIKVFFITLSLIALLLIQLRPAWAQFQNPRNIPYQWNTDTTKKEVALREFIVAVPKGAFAVLNFPTFIDARSASKSYFKHEPVVSIALNGKAKAYPLSILTVHEIANDTLQGLPILVTYCPLCNSSVIYDRRINQHNQEHLLQFGVSGMLRNSDMVMYDLQTETWWQQLIGNALVGKLAGTQLSVIPSIVISLEQFIQHYPDGQILSPKTGIAGAEHRYGKNPYEGYDDPAGAPYHVFFDEQKIDMRLPPMERVIDVESNGKRKVYPFSLIAKKGVVNDSFNGKAIVIFYTGGTVSVLDEKEISRSRKVGSATLFNAVLDVGKLTFVKKGDTFQDEETGSEWDITGRSVSGLLQGKQLHIEPHSNHLAFAFLAFYPHAEIYRE